MAEIILSTGLIGTKYSKPGINRFFINRQRLYQKLNNSLKCKLTMVIAPAGYGKTSAVLEWLEKYNVPAAWLSLDSYDNNPVVFWQYVCAALDDAADGISKETEYVFSSQELIRANIHLNILIDRLSGLEADFLLVLDDLHSVGNPSVLEGLSYLIRYLPAKMHLVIISREKPELELVKYKIKWQVQWLGEKDLRFQSEEIFRFYQTRGFTLENDDIEKVESYTEGWAAALVAIAMSMEDVGRIRTINSLANCRQDIDQYLWEEVISLWPAKKREFIMKTSILDTLCESLCNAITGNTNGGRMLKDIFETNGFLTALDDEGHQYRYHYLFKNFLYKLLLETSPEEIPGLHKNAAFWYREHGFTSEAIEHLLDSCSYQEALVLIERQVDDFIHKNDYITLFSWIDRLPEAYKDSNFMIAMIYAAYHAEMNQFELSREWISRMEALAAGGKYAANPEFVAYSKTLCSLMKANVCVRDGAIDELFPLIQSAGGQNTDSGYKMAEYMDFNAADIYLYRCPVNKSLRIFDKYPDKFDDLVKSYRKMITKNPGYAPLAAGEYLYEKNRLKEALPYLLAAMEEAQTANCQGALVPAMADISRMKRALGDLQGAFEVLEECEKKLQNGKAHWLYLLHALQCRLYMDIGDMNKTDEWFSSCKLSSFTNINRVKEFELIVYARILMAKERLSDAQLMLQRLLNFAEDTGRLHSKVEVLNLLAILAYKKGEMTSAMNYMDKSLLIGLEKGYIRSYIDEKEPMAGLLKQYSRHYRKQKDREGNEALAGYVKLLSEQIQENLQTISAADKDKIAAGISDLLTSQEKRVLEMLLQAYTNKEICDKMDIGLRTVKTHTGNIYSKLGVKNRAQCVKLAREAHFLE